MFHEIEIELQPGGCETSEAKESITELMNVIPDDARIYEVSMNVEYATGELADG